MSRRTALAVGYAAGALTQPLTVLLLWVLTQRPRPKRG